jgi:hypothetical protein
MSERNDWAPRAAKRYAMLLRLYPRRHREDYGRVIGLGPAAMRDTSVCGRRFLALHNGRHLRTILDFPYAGCYSLLQRH